MNLSFLANDLIVTVQEIKVFNQDSNTHRALIRGMILHIQNAREYMG